MSKEMKLSRTMFSWQEKQRRAFLCARRGNQKKRFTNPSKTFFSQEDIFCWSAERASPSVARGATHALFETRRATSKQPSSPARVKGSMRFQDVLRIDVRINLRRRNVCMPEQLLHQ